VVREADEDNSHFGTAASIRWLSLALIHFYPVPFLAKANLYSTKAASPAGVANRNARPTPSVLPRMSRMAKGLSHSISCFEFLWNTNRGRCSKPGCATWLVARQRTAFVSTLDSWVPLANHGAGRPPEASIPLPSVEESAGLTNCVATGGVALFLY
jgi:hypothetical protein